MPHATWKVKRKAEEAAWYAANPDWNESAKKPRVAEAESALTEVACSIYVVFGRPGAGKSTVASALLKKLKSQDFRGCHGVDLDVCVPQWMKENFSKGIYPSLKEREAFAKEASSFLKKEIKGCRLCIVSFSFVNEDLRVKFREDFPDAKWLLYDTPEEVTLKCNLQLKRPH